MQAVVFDLDGVLVDSEVIWDEIRRGVAAEAGVPWPEGTTRALQGMSTAEWSDYLSTTVGVPGAPRLIADRVVTRMAERYRREVPLIPGAVDAVRRLGARWPLGLASSSPRQIIDTVLAVSGLDFAVTVSTEEVSAGKPSPAVYRDVVTRLGTDAAQTAAIEDSSNGLRSASAAGLVVIALPHETFPPAPDALALAAVTLSSLDDLTVEFVDSLQR